MTVELHKRDSLASPDIAGTTLCVTRGVVWITQEDDTRHVVPRSGDTWVVERSGSTIIEAQNRRDDLRLRSAVPAPPAGRVRRRCGAQVNSGAACGNVWPSGIR